jgi:hypothetical protein
MTLSAKIKQIQNKYILIDGSELTFGAIISELGSCDYPVNVNSWSENECVYELGALVQYWLNANCIKERNVNK